MSGLTTIGEAGRAVGLAVLTVQVPLLLLLLARLMPGRTRRPPIAPRLTPRTDTTVTVIVATLNEAKRIGPCLSGLMAQTEPMLEVLVVDSRSTDGTRELVEAAAARDPRIRLVTDEPLPAGHLTALAGPVPVDPAVRPTWALLQQQPNV